ncbi:MAG: DegT/DnrJ/EryC1/StrS family aminotransferase [Pirellulales bacterium]|nr:DegT/DnrJ/EryC1/StrS family aminotransferase [Pirellulales bacterium]
MSFAKRSVPFLSLGGMFEADDAAAAARVMQAATEPGGSFFPMPEEAEFQTALAAHEGAAHAVAFNSCGTALDACMMVLGIGPQDEVITTPLTFVCTATCAAARGARVVFADIAPTTLCLDPAAVRKKISPRTKAILPVHFAGCPADIDGFDAIGRQTGIPVIYDAAHAVGTRYRGRPIGAAGTASCYSFQSNKNITTLGEGGAVTSEDADFAEAVRRKKTFGYVYGGPRLRVVDLGFNYRMTKPQLAVGLTQIAKARRIIALKLAAMIRLRQLLADVEELVLPAGIEDGHGAHLFVVRLDTDKVRFTRDAFQEHLKRQYQVGTAVHYPCVWTWEVFQGLDYDNSDCPIAERAGTEVLSLPVFAQSSEEDLQYAAWAIKQSIQQLTVRSQ